ncbi:MAG: patatin-like phospholipase family protein [Fastidiosipilaceae bacterium]|jgi:NTE family protein|nr:hypothetical protein [Clostridiaceae bacterium]
MNEDHIEQLSYNVSFAGGGIRALALVPVLSYFEDRRLAIKRVAGTSMGSIIATFHAAGFPAEVVKTLILEGEATVIEERLFDYPLLRYIISGRKSPDGLIDVEKFYTVFEEFLESIELTSLNQLIKPLAVPAVDMKTGQIVVFSNEPEAFVLPENGIFYPGEFNIVDMLVASCAIPTVVSSLPLGDFLLADGGVRLNQPVKLFAKEERVLKLALGIDYLKKIDRITSLMDSVQRSLDLLRYELEKDQAEYADIILKIPVEFDDLDMGKGAKVIERAIAYLEEVHLEDYLLAPGIIPLGFPI